MVSRNIRGPSDTFSGIYMNGLFFFLLKVKTTILVHCNGTVVLNIESRNEILLGFKMTLGGNSPRIKYIVCQFI